MQSILFNSFRTYILTHFNAYINLPHLSLVKQYNANYCQLIIQAMPLGDSFIMPSLLVSNLNLFHVKDALEKRSTDKETMADKLHLRLKDRNSCFKNLKIIFLKRNMEN